MSYMPQIPQQNETGIGVFLSVLQKGDPVAGVVVEFAGGPGSWVTKTYSAAKGKGAFLNGSSISASRCKDVNLSLLVKPPCTSALDYHRTLLAT